MSHLPQAKAFPLLIILLTLPAMWPFLSHADYWESHDGLFHLYRLLSLEEAWRQGYLYPRLFPDFAFGYGFAVLNFYSPLTYYLALALSAIGLSAVMAMKLTFMLSYPLSALAVWWLARDVWRADDESANEWAGTVAAVVYTYVPYHLADVQLRGALAESWAFVWWPILFWAIWRGKNWILTFALAGLILTHNLSVVLVAFPLAIWTLLAIASPFTRLVVTTSVVSQGPERLKSLLRAPIPNLILAGIGALALTAFYWLPVILESQYIWIAQDVGGLGFERHLAPLEEWVSAGASYRYFPDQEVAAEHPLSSAQIALLAFALFMLPALWVSQFRRVVSFWWLCMAFVLFLLTPLSLPLWKTFAFPFGLIQYPWRWLGIAALANAMVVSSAWADRARIKRKKEAKGRLSPVTNHQLPVTSHQSPATSHQLPVTSHQSPVTSYQSLVSSYQSPISNAQSLLCTILLLWLAFSSLQYLPWQSRAVDVARHPVPMWEEDAANGQVGATWTAEFLPLSVKEQRWALARAPEVVEDVGQSTSVEVLRAGGDGFSLWAEVEASQKSWLSFPRFAYPSMRVLVDGQAYPLEARGVMGLAAVEFPPGRHEVTLEAYPLANKPWLRWGVGFLPLLLMTYYLLRWDKRWLVLIPLAGLLIFFPYQPDLVTSFEKPILFGRQAQLVGMRHQPIQTEDKIAHVRLLWFNLLQTDQRYNTFVHLTPLGGGVPLAQHDAEPNMNTVPTSRWLTAQFVEDLHLLSLPDELPAGDYELWAGMYAIQDGATAPIADDSGERRFLGVIKIE